MIDDRDLVGYGANPPQVQWPHGNCVAVSFVVNYEEGSERTITHGDTTAECFLCDIVGSDPVPGARSAQMESLYEYGSRAGFWRLHRIFTKYGLPVTVFGVGLAMQKNPEAVAAMLGAGWEIATHGYRWIDYQNIPYETELEHARHAVAVHTQLTNSKPLGWYVGRTSPNSARVCATIGTFLYDSDSYADDFPYYHQPLLNVDGDERYQLVVPYTLDVNDMKYVAYNGFTESEQFFRYLKDQYDVLYDECQETGTGRMMSVGLHCRVAGKPARAAGLIRFIEYIKDKKAWVCRRREIAEHWLTNHPPPGKTFYSTTV